MISCEPLPCNPSAEAALQPLMKGFESLPHARRVSLSPEGGSEKEDPTNTTTQKCHVQVTLHCCVFQIPLFGCPFRAWWIESAIVVCVCVFVWVCGCIYIYIYIYILFLFHTHVYIYIYIYIFVLSYVCKYITYTCIHIRTNTLYIYIYIYILSVLVAGSLSSSPGPHLTLPTKKRKLSDEPCAPRAATQRAVLRVTRGTILHARNRHLRNHRGCSVAFSNGFPVAFPNGIPLFCGIFKRIVTCPVNDHGNVQWIVSGMLQLIVMFVRSGV